jgi:hypothetical protein
MDDDIVDRLLSFGPSIENAIHAIFLWDQDYCISDEDHAESDADTEAMRNLGETIIEAAAEIQRLRTRLAMKELVRQSEELGLYELDADDAG